MVLGRKKASSKKRVIKAVLKRARKKGNYAASKGRLLYNGVAAAPRKPFGSKTGNGKSMASMKACLNALVPKSLGLPRAVGPYTIIRTTTQFSWSKKSTVAIFAPFQDNSPTGPTWLSWAGITQQGLDTDAIGDPLGILPILMPTSELGAASEIVPASMTIQCMNGKNLQNADGIFYAARVNQGLNYGGSSVTWGQLKAQIISYFSPRLMAGSKLALRGVTSHSYPLNMQEYSDFGPRSNISSTIWTPFFQPCALAPIVFIRGGEQDPDTATDLSFLITMEWRVRFDPLNPAAASHTYHEVTADSVWNGVIKSASSEGHGIVDTVEDISLTGAMAAAGRFAISNPELW
uniref:Putative capsid n=1 Tax=Barns Ness breadcrumb sponge weivirus-like virus 2 TaxID=2021889 RepID=A0A221LFH4_9VIRU|nr:putative capsid [Barns Ness breadcrumb sponge weivirus-like virus 2]